MASTSGQANVQGDTTANAKGINLTDLPPELFPRIIGKLNYKGIVALDETCRALHQAVKSFRLKERAKWTEIQMADKQHWGQVQYMAELYWERMGEALTDYLDEHGLL